MFEFILPRCIEQLVDGLRTLGRIIIGHMDKGMSGSAKDTTINKISKEKDFADIKRVAASLKMLGS